MPIHMGLTAIAKMYLGVALVSAAYAGTVSVLAPLTPVTLAPPAGLDWTPPITVTRTGPVYATTFDITSLIPAATVTYFVDPIGGNDANAGTTRGLPLQKLSVALAKTNADQIRIINLSADYAALSTFGWAGTQPTKSIAVINESSTYRFLSVRSGSSSPPVWSLNGTYSNVYQTTLGASSSTDLADMQFFSNPEYVNLSGSTVTSTSHPKALRRLVKVASLAAVTATAGTWYNDGTVTYARAHDDRSLIGDIKMLVLMASGNNGRPNLTVNNLALYVSGIDFVGGAAFFDNKVGTVTGQTLAFNNCSFQCAGVGSFGGLSVKAASLVYVNKCAAYNNQADGFNYKSSEADAGLTLGTSSKFIEIDCISYGNGQWNGSVSTTDNCTTAHDDCRGLRLNGIYPESSDRPIHDIDKSKSWNLGCFIGAARDSAMPSVVAGLGSSTAGSNNIYLDGCSIRSGANPQVRAELGSAIYYANMTGLANAGSGTLAEYTP